MDPIERKLGELGLTLPEPLVPSASYIPFRINGNTLMLAGVTLVTTSAPAAPRNKRSARRGTPA